MCFPPDWRASAPVRPNFNDLSLAESPDSTIIIGVDSEYGHGSTVTVVVPAGIEEVRP